jgi:hypothetical protein
MIARAVASESAVVQEMVGKPPSDGVRLRWAFALEPAADGTLVHARLELTLDPDSPLAPLRAPICRQLAQRLPADLLRLQEWLAAGAAAPAAVRPTTADELRTASARRP